jgi:hypothetical protein
VNQRSRLRLSVAPVRAELLRAAQWCSGQPRAVKLPRASSELYPFYSGSLAIESVVRRHRADSLRAR